MTAPYTRIPPPTELDALSESLIWAWGASVHCGTDVGCHVKDTSSHLQLRKDRSAFSFCRSHLVLNLFSRNPVPDLCPRGSEAIRLESFVRSSVAIYAVAATNTLLTLLATH
jgi:hypothetical protein